MSQSSLPYIAISSAVALTLAGSNYNQISQYLATQGEIQSVSNCPVFTLDSIGDPHIDTTINGTSTTTYSNEDAHNLATIENTDGGSTRMSTTVGYDPFYNAYTNTTVTQKHTGSGAWKISAMQSADGTLALAVSDATGLHNLAPGQSVTEPDGSTISMTGAGTATVLQKLSWGGVVETTYQSNGDMPGSQAYTGVSVYIQGNGEAIINGTTARQATGSETALLPCFAPAASSGGGMADSGGSDSGSTSAAYDPAQQSSM